MIHGDPVFSNVLLNDDGAVFLLDMRGELGSTLTLQVRRVATSRGRHASLVSPPSSIPPHPNSPHTLQGDALYDLSKVYQSLLGYDYILLSQPLLERDGELLAELRHARDTRPPSLPDLTSHILPPHAGELLEELRHAFRRFVSEHYPAVRMADITRLTAQHYFGIVPLHQNQQHQLAYLQTCAALLSSVGLEARHSDPTSPGAGGPSSSRRPPAPAPAPSPLSAGGSAAAEEPSAERSRRHSAPSVAPQLDNV